MQLGIKEQVNGQAKALDLGVPLPLITESVFARYISAYKEERVQASKILSRTNDFEFTGDKRIGRKIREALYFSKIMSYAQGFAQLRVASKNLIGTCHLVKSQNLARWMYHPSSILAKLRMPMTKS